ncbi:hypothetical protein DK289_02890 [Escherichia coli]|nr:hypothetical protein CWI33_22275 [Escherichia coli]PBO92632.1 hypothetical protein CI711_14135 [Shigella boydii]EFN9862365.1 hypothetical protein [Escherichia coli]OZR98608.1 hypothetical protein CIG25_07315 [Escherichia coli]PPV96572.1 hypothetical protein C5P25_04395 [Escherichia coli]
MLIKQNHPILLQHPFLSLPSSSTNYQQLTIIIKKKGLNLLHPINKKSVTSFEITDFTNLPDNQINALLPPCAFVHSGIRKSAHFSLYPARR